MFKKVKKFFLEVVSLSTPRGISSLIIFFLTILRIVPKEKIGNYCIFSNFILPKILNTCPTGGLFAGCTCPACGLTRATANVLRGNMEEAYELNKLIVIVFPFIILLLILNLAKIILPYFKKAPKCPK